MSNQPRSWPNLVGRDGNEVVQIIKQETGFTNVHVVSMNSPMTMDYRTDRVRVMVDAQGKVASAPSVC